ncbi:hypothetical protein [Burkholderia phage BCSR129]|nr:hypothetical protein [Burkholderia phage BCSR129]
MTTENRRADALTDAQRKSLLSHADEMDAYGWKDDAEAIRLLLAAPPASQPAAAPIDEPVAAWINYPVKTVDGEFAGYGKPELSFTRPAYGYDGDKAEPLYRRAPAPSPADERAAFIESYVRTLPPENRAVDPGAACRFAESVIGARGPGWQLWLAGIAYARAASANETGAEAVAWQVQRTDGRINSISVQWENCTKDLYDATLLTGRYAGHKNGPRCKVRALYAAPQPSQADARVGLTDEQRAMIKAGVAALKLVGFVDSANEIDKMLASMPMHPRTGSGS